MSEELKHAIGQAAWQHLGLRGKLGLFAESVEKAARIEASHKPPVWLPMESAPLYKPIVAICRHEEGLALSDLYKNYSTNIGRVEDGVHVIQWGGESEDYDERRDITLKWPPWWFRAGSEWEDAAFPVAYLPIPSETEWREGK